MTTVWPTSSPTGTLTTGSLAWLGSGLLQVGTQLQTHTWTPGVVQRHDGNLLQIICWNSTLSVWFTDPLCIYIYVLQWFNMPVWVCLILQNLWASFLTHFWTNTSCMNYTCGGSLYKCIWIKSDTNTSIRRILRQTQTIHTGKLGMQYA